MTGFGRAEVTAETIGVAVEARSVNHRHLDIALRLPRALASLEIEARHLVQARLERGRVDIAVQLAAPPGLSEQTIALDAALARQYVERARALGDTLDVEGDVTLTWVLERPGVVRVEEAEVPEPSHVWIVLADALGRALDELVARRTAEGEALAGELRVLHADLQSTVELLAARAPVAMARRAARLRERVTVLLAGGVVDEGRLLTELAVAADKADVTEELARLRAHLEQFTQILDKGGSVGRQLDFLLQELNREVNTIAAKADDLELGQSAIAAKGILEKVREQVQNLE
ncbi:MAG TPA: YicC/YloC family endoribonuclease [Methylomirabilota bacterium]|jgi:uncharacterized protein (TIGR00255 family)